MIVPVFLLTGLVLAALTARHIKRQIAAAQAMADKHRPKDPQKKEKS